MVPFALDCLLVEAGAGTMTLPQVNSPDQPSWSKSPILGTVLLTIDPDRSFSQTAKRLLCGVRLLRLFGAT
jgi:hypothetical protein